MSDEDIDRLHEEAGIYAAELVGPNSPEYEAVWERRFEELLEKANGNASSLQIEWRTRKR